MDSGWFFIQKPYLPQRLLKEVHLGGHPKPANGGHLKTGQ
jgi:hypothetical protein